MDIYRGIEGIPVKIFVMYLGIEIFYLAINRNRPREESAWYKASPMGVDTIGSILKRMSVKAGLVGRFTNHSLRRTTCQRLLEKNVPPVLIAQLTGHKSISSLGHYVVENLNQQKAMASILQGNSSTDQNIPPLRHKRSQIRNVLTPVSKCPMHSHQKSVIHFLNV